MSRQAPDTYVVLGTPARVRADDRDEPYRKKPLREQDQVARDDRGQRRFHGAFTGGFSAGYFNTVGSREGWQPSTFVSSRSQRASDVDAHADHGRSPYDNDNNTNDDNDESGGPRGRRGEQRPEDFMDEEDMGEFGIAPRRLIATSQFAGDSDQSGSRKRTYAPDSFEARLVDELFVPTDKSIGKQLLKKMGWREGRGIGPRAVRSARSRSDRGAEDPDTNMNGGKAEAEEDPEDTRLYAPEDSSVVEFAPKLDMHGLGYTSQSLRTAGGFQLFQEEDTARASSSVATVTRGDGTSRSETSALRIDGRVGPRGGIGISVLEDDDDPDVYEEESRDIYDRVVGGGGDAQKSRAKHNGKNEKTKTKTVEVQDALQGSNDESELIKGFVRASITVNTAPTFPAPPPVPSDYTPRARFAVPTTITTAAPSSRSFLEQQRLQTPGERGRLLQEQQQKQETPTSLAKGQSVFDLLKPSDRARLEQRQTRSDPEPALAPPPLHPPPSAAIPQVPIAL